ncbi:hypothetical protein GCM10010121_001830 [Streptomyces brasiliensis]|uniref:Uncharacterized protein n=1 Tax=Streptomyces brasiliensis TaxID=1954 RepID=A0A917K2I2_9ACTN|nr:hypothetical protein GCM10010121_001830 [Streptomyces brasiliensis]
MHATFEINAPTHAHAIVTTGEFVKSLAQGTFPRGARHVCRPRGPPPPVPDWDQAPSATLAGGTLRRERQRW